ncbi:LPS assembly lipoprotein LptE [Wenxinia saemankumensis]|uniref:LPS-assembly lipoprotein n=1 Tax=Wenxinia saemankumensis TaxID=1447782 RepID=A0A1M6FWY9_9RHOB|nr:LPS assembly lipoprotein LptE [Wenxinia saemankumensis]SHJ02245.1 LPS-assembly lipoprotein [Wenxinia saemankumensis]
MWSLDPRAVNRRAVLRGLAALPLAGCGFSPVYGPGGPGEALRGQVRVDAPETTMGYRLQGRLEDRLGGRPDAPRYALSVTIGVEREATAFARDAGYTRFTLLGEAGYRLVEGSALIAEGSVDGFTAYSATASTVATGTARDDAERRLAILLADQILNRLILAVA